MDKADKALSESDSADVYIRLSQDYGKTFGPSIKINNDNNSINKDVRIKGDGMNVYAVYAHVVKDFAPLDIDKGTVLMSSSHDGGRTFGPPIIPHENAAIKTISHKPDVLVMPEGKIAIADTTQKWNDEEISTVYVHISHDFGKTFKSIPVSTNSSKGNLGIKLVAMRAIFMLFIWQRIQEIWIMPFYPQILEKY